MKLLKEFKEFALKGNVMDMAIGVIINRYSTYNLLYQSFD